MTNVKYLKHAFNSMQGIIVKKISYLMEYKRDVCCFVMNDVRWIQYFLLVQVCAIFNKNKDTNESCSHNDFSRFFKEIV